MLQNKKRYILLILFLFFNVFLFYKNASAAPARSEKFLLTQPDGTSFYARIKGDEWLNWIEGEKGDVIIKGTDNYWYYAQLNLNKLTKTDRRYKIDPKPQNSVTGKTVSKNSKKLLNAKYSSSILRAIQRTTDINPVTNWNQKILVVLVEFSDVKIKNSDSVWNNQFFGTTGKTVRTYYREVSENKFNFIPADETYNNYNDGIIKVQLPYNHPNTGPETDYRNQQLVIDALTKASNDKYIDFSKFDTNNNGYIDNSELHIVTIIAGYECSYSGIYSSDKPSVWGHRWSISGLKLNGKYVCSPYYGGYTQQGEIHGSYYYNDDHIATIGILCHELGHDLGLPDLYDYDYSSEGVGIHSIMAVGSWASLPSEYLGASPVHFDAWSKIMLGFANPTVVSQNSNYTINSFASPSGYNVLKIPTQNSNEYFLLENRQFNGFDQSLSSYLISGGIEILHIDENVYYANYGYGINDDESHKAVDVEEANEGELEYSQLDNRIYWDDYDHYYYVGGFTSFNSISTPSSKLYDGSDSEINIEVLSTSSNSMDVQISFGPTLSKTVTFKDKELERAIREALNKPEGEITDQDMLNLYSLSMYGYNITDITGLEYAKNLTYLDLTNNSIKDIKPLSGLRKLTNLYLDYNLISDISPLSNLTELSALDLAHNSITNIYPLINLNKLIYLNLSGNRITNFEALLYLSNLELLDLSYTGFTNISSIINLTGLKHLYLNGNKLTNFNLISNFYDLYTLELYNTGITSISPLRNMNNLLSLNIGGNRISDLSLLSNFKNLYSLDLSNAGLTNISFLQNLTQLEKLKLSYNSITDISPLSNLINLYVLKLNNNSITNISALSKMTDLIELNISNNKISDISVLSDLTFLSMLNISGNKITNISSLSSLENLSILIMNSNSITDISSLENLTNIFALYADNNNIQSIDSIANMQDLYLLSLSNNPITNIEPIGSIPNLFELNINGIKTSDFSPIEGLHNLFTLSLSNNNISNLDFISTLSRLRYLNLSGNEISDLTPLEGLVNLKQLKIDSNNISDITSLVILAQNGAFKGIEKTRANTTNADRTNYNEKELSNLKNTLNYTNSREKQLDIIKSLSETQLEFGYGEGYIDVTNNLLDISPGTKALNDIYTIKSNGITIYYQPQKGIPVYVTKTSPADNTENVATNNLVITVTFDRKIALGTGASLITLTDMDGTNIPVTSSVSNNILTIKPLSKVKVLTKYTVTIPKNAVKDYSNSTLTLGSNYSFSFTTTDDVAPSITTSTPTQNASDASLTQEIRIVFDESIQLTDNFACTLLDKSNKPISIIYEISKDNPNMLIVKPEKKLSPLSSYTFKLVKGSIRDSYGNICNSDITIKFKTADSPVPYVISSTPASASQNIDVKAQIKIKYNKPIQVLNSNLIVLEDKNGNKIDISWSLKNSELTITPKSSLDYYSDYKFSILKGAVSYAEGANATDEDYSLTFKTKKPETTAPKITVLSSTLAYIDDTTYVLSFKAEDKSNIKSALIKWQYTNPSTGQKETITATPVLNEENLVYTAALDLTGKNSSYTIEVCDQWDNAAQKSLSVTKQTDSAKPTITITNPRVSTVSISNYLTSYNLAFNVFDAISGIEKVTLSVKVDNTDTISKDIYNHTEGFYEKSLSFNETLENLGVRKENGTAVVTITVVDRAGNVQSKAITIKRIADIKAPTVTFKYPKSTSTTVSTNRVTLDFKAVDDSGIKSIILILNGTEQRVCSYDETIFEVNSNIDVDIENGLNTIKVRVTDNMDNIFEKTFTITKK